MILVNPLLLFLDIHHVSFQESNFYYMFGVQEKGFAACIELDTNKITLFAPNAPLTTRIFYNPLRKADVKDKYNVNACYESTLEVFVEFINPVIFAYCSQ